RRVDLGGRRRGGLNPLRPWGRRGGRRLDGPRLWFDRERNRIRLGDRGSRFGRWGTERRPSLFFPTQPLAFPAAQGRRSSLFGFRTLACETLLRRLFNRQQVDGGRRKMAGPARQECNGLVLDIQREPTAADRRDANGLSLPSPQLAAAVLENNVLIVELDDHLQLGRGVAVQLNASIERSVFFVGEGLGHGHLRRIGA
ncbi:MAG: hypothetical protein RI637_10800, partial [Acidimicrobiia bacterium]|nr:hypothetical protein [Acidimicrobiia bacterium]